MSYATWDLETGIKLALKRKATPFYKTNPIVAFGVKYKGDERPTGIYFPDTPDPQWFVNMLAKAKLLVGFNMKFDLLHALNESELNRAAWIKWVVAGGQVWDCQFAEYMLHGAAQEQHMLSLDEVAPRYGGNLKNDAVKALWAAGVDTMDIDRDLLMEYLLGTIGRDDVPLQLQAKGDIDNTEAIFLGQLAAFRARGAVPHVMMNMGALLFTVEAEFNGMFVDKALGLELAKGVKAELDELEVKLTTYLPEGLPFEFKWTSRFHLSALIFGGDVKYVAKGYVLDDAGEKTYYQKDETHYVLADGSTMEVAAWTAAMAGGGFIKTTTPTDVERELGHFDEEEQTWNVPLSMPMYFSGGKNKGTPKTKKVKVPDIERGPKMRNEDFIYTFAGFTEPDSEWESSTPGVYSVSSAVIEALGERDIPFLKDLAQRAALAKDLGTYYITTDEETGEQKGMLTLVGPDGIIHHQLHMNRTVTMRLSSSDPNLQNVSGGQKSQVKTVFVSRYGPDGKIIQSDFTALEIYVQAILTMCRQLLEDLRAGLDMHCARAYEAWGKAEGLTYEDVYRLAVTEEDKTWKYKRKNAKVFSFQRAYGAGVAKIAKTTGMSEAEVEALVEAEAERYPEVDEFYVKLTAAIQKNRVPTSRFINHPQVPGLQCQLGRSHYLTPDRKMYSYSEQPSPKWVAEKPASKGGTPQSFSPTEIRNYVVQGTGGEWAKAAMWLAVRAFYAKDNFGGKALLVNQVHDAIYCDAHPDVAVEAAALLEACMLEASNLMEYQFKWPLPIGVPTETKYGASMMEESSLPEGFKARVADYRAWVREQYVGNNIPTYERS